MCKNNSYFFMLPSSNQSNLHRFLDGTIYTLMLRLIEISLQVKKKNKQTKEEWCPLTIPKYMYKRQSISHQKTQGSLKKPQYFLKAKKWLHPRIFLRVSQYCTMKTAPETDKYLPKWIFKPQPSTFIFWTCLTPFTCFVKRKRLLAF